MDSIRVVLSIVVADNLKLRQFNIATAFLNDTLQEEIFMQPLVEKVVEINVLSTLINVWKER
jgi:hypothetical protein